MRSWQPSYTLAAGLAVIIITNAVALGGVAYNRSGEPESTLLLTDRELRIPPAWGFEKENSGVSLQIAWRIHPGPQSEAPDYGRAHGGDASWLDGAKLAALGFDLSDAALQRGRQLPREAFLVLEMDGDAHRAAIERAERRAKRKPGEWTLRWLKEEKEDDSRLFVVDAGPNAASLRAKYANRSQYAIVKGNVALHYHRNLVRPVQGRISDISINGVNVPIDKHGVVARNATYQATVAFGKRLEPWLTAASPRQR